MTFISNKKPPINSKNSRFISIALSILITIYALFFAMRKIENFDIWFHLKAGELFFSKGKVILVDVFSHTMLGAKWIPHEWLSEILFYLIYKIGGVEGIGILSAVIIASATLLTWLRGKNMESNPWILASLMLWMLLNARFRFMVRPHIFFFLLMSTLLFLLEQNSRTQRKIFAWGVIPLMILWVNQHGSFLLGYLFLIVWALDCFIRNRKQFPLIILAIATVALLLNPGGWQMLASVKDLFLSTTLTRTVVNEEFLPPTWSGYKLFWIFLIFSIVVITSTIKFSRPSLLELASFVLTMVLAIRGVRYIAIFVFTTTPFVAYRLSMILDRFMLNLKWDTRFSSSAYSVLSGVVLIILMGVVFINAYNPQKSYQWGLGINERFFPIGAANFLNQTELQDVRLYNSKQFGGYLIWSLYPRFRVSMDGRDEIFGPLLAQMRSKDWTKYFDLMKRYRFQIAVIGYDHKDGFESLLANDPMWVLVYWDDKSLIYARREELPKSFISKWSYKFISPFSLDYSYLVGPVRNGKGEEVIAELNRAISSNPNSFKPLVYLGFVKGLLGKTTETATAYEKALSINPKLGLGHYQLAAKLGRVYLALGKPEKAKIAFEHHFSTHAQKGIHIYPYALSLYMLKDYEKSEKMFRRYLNEKPNDPEVLANFGFLLVDTERLKEAEQIFQKAIKVAPLGPGLYGIALTYQKMGDCEKAIPLWKQLIHSKKMPQKWAQMASQYIDVCKGQESNK